MAKQNQAVATHITETKVGTKNELKVKRLNRAQCANNVVAAMNGRTTLGTLAKQADEMFVSSGGKSKMRVAIATVRRSLETLESAGVLRLQRPTDLVVERVNIKS